MTRSAPRCLVVVCALAMSAIAVAPASSAPPTDPLHPWQYDHWPQTQPWQQGRPAEPAAARLADPGFPAPIDPQNWVNPDTMT
jgi:hypothetical protein